jgi:hypothetical protein
MNASPRQVAVAKEDAAFAARASPASQKYPSHQTSRTLLTPANRPGVTYLDPESGHRWIADLPGLTSIRLTHNLIRDERSSAPSRPPPSPCPLHAGGCVRRGEVTEENARQIFDKPASASIASGPFCA